MVIQYMTYIKTKFISKEYSFVGRVNFMQKWINKRIWIQKDPWKNRAKLTFWKISRKPAPYKIRADLYNFGDKNTI